jgi:hypothetical protein
VEVEPQIDEIKSGMYEPTLYRMSNNNADSLTQTNNGNTLYN